MFKNPHTFLSALFGPKSESPRKLFHSIKAKADAKRTPTEKLADAMTRIFGSVTFLILNVLVFVFWVIINTNQIESIQAFDPFPFSLLTTVLSLEAIILAIFVLITQNRNMKIDDLREEIQLQIDIIAEKEITKLMKMMALLLEKNGIDESNDPELKKFSKPISESEIEERLKKEIFQ